MTVRLNWLLLPASLVALAPGDARAQQLFEDPGSIPLLRAPTDLVVADLDGDDVPDLLTPLEATSIDPEVAVLLGNGDGTFLGPSYLELSSSAPPTASAVADVDGDDIPDLMTLFRDSLTSHDVAVQLGNGNGTFQAPVIQQAPPSAGIVRAADLNGDDDVDLVVAASIDPDVTVWLGNGDGTFQASVAHPTGTEPRSVAIADLDLDGAPDLAVADSDGDVVTVLRGNGDGSFGVAEPFATGDGPLFVAAADLDGDGVPDLVTADDGRQGNSVSVLLNQAPFPPVPAVGPVGLLVLVGGLLAALSRSKVRRASG